MALDNRMIAGLREELDGRLRDARVDKVYMPRRDRVVLHLRVSGIVVKLLLSVGGDARVHLTDEKFEYPDAPPMFCMLLRKHMSGARITGVTRPEGERILELCFTAVDEMGDLRGRKLVCELTGRLTNLLLLEDDGVILACLKNVDEDTSPRPVMQGLRYRLPPRPDQLPAEHLQKEALAALCADCTDPQDLCGRVSGVSPLLAREAFFRAQGDSQKAAAELHDLLSAPPRPYLLTVNGVMREASAFEILQYGGDNALFPDFSSLLDIFYSARARADSIRAAASEMTRVLQNTRDRLRRKLTSQRQELEEARRREELKHCADLITANLYAIKSGDREVMVTDYFDERLPQVRIELDPQKSPQQNAQRLYARYARMKNAEAALVRQIELGAQELEYAESVLYNLSEAGDLSQLTLVRQELLENGYLKSREKGRKKLKEPPFAPRSFPVDGGMTLLCGRNNGENDLLTHRHSNKWDLWFHARGVPGCHAVLLTEGREPSEKALEQAAAAAAYFSTAKNQPRAAVDYTRIKYVKKPQGARPGMVNYFEYKTALVTPALPEEIL